MLADEGLLLEENADRILQEVGIEFHGAPDALELFADAGASVDGERVRFPGGLCRSLVKATAPEQFTQVARTARTSRLRRRRDDLRAGLRLPVRPRPRQRAPVRDDRGLPNFGEARLRAPWIHHSGGTVCEPVDVPVNKRHFDMVYAHLRYSD